MNVIYKKRVWKVLAPAGLKFPNGSIRNLLIERNKERVITNLKACKKFANFKPLNQF